MMKQVFKLVTILTVLVALGIAMTACQETPKSPAPPSTEVKQVAVKIETDLNGLTVEQKNIGNRLLADNKPGSTKHLYVISAYSGQVLMYSTVAGKVTSSGKRLSPTTVAAMEGQYVGSNHTGCAVHIPGHGTKATSEVLQDDGTYGSSEPYIYWWDTKGVYHQHYVSGGQIIHISDSPIAVKGVVMNLSLSAE